MSAFLPLRTHSPLLFLEYVPLPSWFLISLWPSCRDSAACAWCRSSWDVPIRWALREEDVSVSVVVPCRNEQGNIQDAVERIPDIGRHTEII